VSSLVNFFRNGGDFGLEGQINGIIESTDYKNSLVLLGVRRKDFKFS